MEQTFTVRYCDYVANFAFDPDRESLDEGPTMTFCARDGARIAPSEIPVGDFNDLFDLARAQMPARPTVVSTFETREEAIRSFERMAPAYRVRSRFESRLCSDGKTRWVIISA